MISIKYDFPPLARSLASERASERALLSSSRAQVSSSSSSSYSSPSSSSSISSSSATSLSSRWLLSSLLSHLSSLSLPAGVTQGLTHSLIISFQCTVRNSPATRTRTHVHTTESCAFALARSLSPSFSLSRSLARCGGHRLLDFIEFSSSARGHPVQTRIRQLTPLACGGSAIKPAVREVEPRPRADHRALFRSDEMRGTARRRYYR